MIEYLCTGEYNPNCEAGISPISKDIDWSICDANLKDEFFRIENNNPLISKKDKDGFSLKSWLKVEDSNNFVYNKIGRKI